MFNKQKKSNNLNQPYIIEISNDDIITLNCADIYKSDNLFAEKIDNCKFNYIMADVIRKTVIAVDGEAVANNTSITTCNTVSTNDSIISIDNNVNNSIITNDKY